MREILFRGKRLDNGEWIEGWYQPPARGIGVTLAIFESDSESLTDILVDHETVGQYTGLTDKNGKKIFEGDIVKTKFGRMCIVVWFSSQVCNGWDLETVRTLENCVRTKPPTPVDLYKKENLEIVGNIHDNPELSHEH